MASITIEGTAPDQLPAREDGTDYPFAAVVDDVVILADTRTELTAALIGGYAELPEGEEGDEKALFSRYTSTVAIANQRQGVLAGAAAEAGTFDPSTESEDVLTALFTEKNEKIDEISEWSHHVPLVLVASGYAPYTNTPRPTGNVVWLDPFTETTYLNTLSTAGVIELFVRDDS